MQIILLDEARFDQFAISHPNHNYYQTSNYGRLMTKHGHNAYYLGLAAEDGEIKAATLIIVKNDKKKKRKMGYAPRGFLIKLIPHKSSHPYDATTPFISLLITLSK